MLIVLWVIIVIGTTVFLVEGSKLLNRSIRSWTHAKAVIEPVERDELPNYWHISHLEFELFGVTFHNPDPAPYCGPCRCAACRYRVDPVNVHASELYVNGLPEWQDREGD